MEEKSQPAAFSVLQIGKGGFISDLGDSQDVGADVCDGLDYRIDAALRFRELTRTIITLDVVLKIEPGDLDLGGR